MLHLGPDGTPYPLTHYDRDVFTFEPTGENAYGPSAVTFTVQADGTASSVIIDYFDHDGQGAFNRADSGR